MGFPDDQLLTQGNTDHLLNMVSHNITTALILSIRCIILCWFSNQSHPLIILRTNFSHSQNTTLDIPFTTHMIKCADNVSIHAWLLHQKSPSAASVPTIIFFHGNAGNIGLRLPNAEKMYHYLGCNIFMVEYRGYGDSDDVKPNEKGLKLDAEAAYQYLLNQNNHVAIDTNKVFVFGRSLGGAVAFHLAKYAEYTIQKPLAGIIIENTFTSISKMVDQLMPIIAPLKFLVLRMDWNSERIAPLLQTPILYLAGDRDELVPHSHMQDLYRKSGQRSMYPKMHIIRGGTHNDSWVQGGREYYSNIKAFISHVIVHGVSALDGNHNNSNNMECASTSSMEVTMGDERLDSISTPTTTTSISSSAIPIMPKNIIGMAKEATKSFTTDASSKKKEI